MNREIPASAISSLYARIIGEIDGGSAGRDKKKKKENYRGKRKNKFIRRGNDVLCLQLYRGERSEKF